MSEAIPAEEAPPDVKVGDTIYHNEGWRDRWNECKVTGETKQSWLVEYSWRKEVRISKKDLTAASFNPSHHLSRERFYTAAAKDKLVEQWEWMKRNERPFKQFIECAKGPELRKISTILQEAGLWQEK